MHGFANQAHENDDSSLISLYLLEQHLSKVFELERALPLPSPAVD